MDFYPSATKDSYDLQINLDISNKKFYNLNSFDCQSIHNPLYKLDDAIEEIYPIRFRSGEKVGDHLEFALKYDGVKRDKVIL